MVSHQADVRVPFPACTVPIAVASFGLMGYRLVPRALLVSVLLLGCDDAGEQSPTCAGEPALLGMTLPEALGASDVFEATFEVENFEFSMEGDGDHGTGGHHDGDADATGCLVGHVHLYVDDLMTNPIAQQTFAIGVVTLPSDISAGEHTFIARLHDASHLIIEPQITLEQTFTVQ